MEIDLKYGARALRLSIPDSRVLGVLDMAERAAPADAWRVVEDALSRPANSAPLRDLASGRSSVLIVVPDKTRRCGCEQFVAALLDRLNSWGVPDRSVTLLFANGTHSRQTPSDREAIVGPAAFRRTRCLDHDCRDASQLISLGTTRAGTPVLINRLATDSDLILVIGAVNHHYFAGYGGGVKMLVPGVAGFETALRNHSLSIDPATGGLHPNCRNGLLDGNPVYEDLVEAARLIRTPVFLIATVMNSRNQLLAAFAGDIVEANRRGGALVDSLYRVPIRQRADLVIASTGGYPKDIDVIQTHKTLERSFEAVRKGGVIILLAECCEGLGSQRFEEWMRLDDDAFRRKSVHDYAQHAQTAASFRAKVRDARVWMVTSLARDLVERFGMRYAASLDEGFAAAQKELPPDYTAYVIPNGSLAIPALAPSQRGVP